MWIMAMRNIKIFFRDRSAVFFSLLAVFIIIGLYVVFLGDTITKGYEGVDGASFLINSWVMAGILAVTSITTTMGAFGIMVNDRDTKILKDFYSSPMKRRDIAGGYIISACVVGILMSLVTFIIAEVYIVGSGGELISLVGAIELISLIVLAVLASSSMVFFIVTFFKSQKAFATVSTIIGTLIGFLTGVYIPIGVLPDAVQWIIKIFPVSHAGALMRQVLLEKPMAISFANAPIEIIDSFEKNMGVVFEIGGTTLDVSVSIMVLMATAVLFYGLSVIKISRSI
ncbi:ABC transporter [Desulfuribacillus stibiiarsenatis]|uniref:Transport permease protein n=1 Tax=Desulfuribacillus stibiiarsenatis TaxID=1390249 RepID=A0A1E5L2L2_9FIRM|nr:ABC transporter permease [Desulfuribacillus stibiiarsenatis]OEH84159.1 ABC transporter [Desulfuribacillus stibiiarsenatis]